MFCFDTFSMIALSVEGSCHACPVFLSIGGKGFLHLSVLLCQSEDGNKSNYSVKTTINQSENDRPTRAVPLCGIITNSQNLLKKNY